MEIVCLCGRQTSSLDLFSQDPSSQLVDGFCRGCSGWVRRSGVSQAVETLRVFCSDVFLPLQVLLDDESSVPKDWLGEPSLGALTVSL